MERERKEADNTLLLSLLKLQALALHALISKKSAMPGALAVSTAPRLMGGGGCFPVKKLMGPFPLSYFPPPSQLTYEAMLVSIFWLHTLVCYK